MVTGQFLGPLTVLKETRVPGLNAFMQKNMPQPHPVLQLLLKKKGHDHPVLLMKIGICELHGEGGILGLLRSRSVSITWASDYAMQRGTNPMYMYKEYTFI